MSNQPMFTTIPDFKNMVTEPADPNHTHFNILCVECGWESDANFSYTADVFFRHTCKLRTSSISTI